VAETQKKQFKIASDLMSQKWYNYLLMTTTQSNLGI